MDDWLEIKCTCGDPLSPNTIHRTDGPCYQKDKKWVSLPSDEEILEMSKDAWGRAMLSYGREDHKRFYIEFARAIERWLKEHNTSNNRKESQ